MGDVIAAAVYQTGQFRRADAVYVWAILAGSAVGLLASTMGRLYSSAFYSLRDTRTPLRFAVIRVALATLFGYLASQYLPDLAGVPRRWGVAGISIASGFCGWIEFTLLRASLNRRIGKSGLDLSYLTRLWCGAGAGAVGAWVVKIFTGQFHPIFQAIMVLGSYGTIYLVAAFAMKIPEIQSLSRIIKFFRR